MEQVEQRGWENRPNPRGRVTHPVLGSLSCVLADGAGADVPGWLEDGRQGARALHVTHDRMARLPKASERPSKKKTFETIRLGNSRTRGLG